MFVGTAIAVTVAAFLLSGFCVALSGIVSVGDRYDTRKLLFRRPAPTLARLGFAFGVPLFILAVILIALYLA